MTPRAPDFIGIGAQKAGTYWLRANLARHSGIWMPPRSELHYFDRTLESLQFPPAVASERLADPQRRVHCLAEFRERLQHLSPAEIAWWAMYYFLDHDDDWYKNLFSHAPASTLVGEITPRYAICGESEIAHMHRIAPAAKLLFILRHPVERFWSQCKMKYADGTLGKGEPAAMALFDQLNGRARGEYSATLERFCNYYEPSQILLLFYDAIIHEPQALLDDVFAFLNLPPLTLPGEVIRERVNCASDTSPIPDSLRGRLSAAYRSEIETLAEVFGSYATTWLDGENPVATQPAIHLSDSHLETIRERPARLRAARLRNPIKIFCLSMQRSGTTSVGDWLEAHCLRRAGSPTSVRLGWTRLWLEGKFEQIYASPEFQAAEILEDDPWWCPGYHRHLAERFPEARFVLLTRDPDEWFDSLCHHSGGLNPGWSDVHARIYNREAELQLLLQNNPTTLTASGGLLSIVEHRDHYKAIYQRHIEEVRKTFADASHRLFLGRLEDSQSFLELCEFAGVKRNDKLLIPRSNARTEEMRRQLAARLVGNTK